MSSQYQVGVRRVNHRGGRGGLLVRAADHRVTLRADRCGRCGTTTRWPIRSARTCSPSGPSCWWSAGPSPGCPAGSWSASSASGLPRRGAMPRPSCCSRRSSSRPGEPPRCRTGRHPGPGGFEGSRGSSPTPIPACRLTCCPRCSGWRSGCSSGCSCGSGRKGVLPERKRVIAVPARQRPRPAWPRLPDPPRLPGPRACRDRRARPPRHRPAGPGRQARLRRRACGGGRQPVGQPRHPHRAQSAPNGQVSRRCLISSQYRRPGTAPRESRCRRRGQQALHHDR